MSETLSGAVAALRQTATLLTDASARTHAHDPGVVYFGGDGPGRLGELGRALHRQWQTTLDSRAREAAAVGARISDIARSLSRAAAGYSDTDHSSGRRHESAQDGAS